MKTGRPEGSRTDEYRDRKVSCKISFQTYLDLNNLQQDTGLTEQQILSQAIIEFIQKSGV